MVGLQPVRGIFWKLGSCAASLQLLDEHHRRRQAGLAPGQVWLCCARPEAAVLCRWSPVSCQLRVHVFWAMAYT